MVRAPVDEGAIVSDPALVAIKRSAAFDLKYLDAREAEQVIHDRSAQGEVPKETTESARSFLEKRASV